MRAEFPWIPVYTTLYFEADPRWLLRSTGIVTPRFLYPSLHYLDLLEKTRVLVIAPPVKLRPLKAKVLGEQLSLLRRELESTVPRHPLQAITWARALKGLNQAETWSQLSA